MLATKFLDPKNDYAFKQIFGTEKNQGILVHFLNDVLVLPGNAKIVTVSFLTPIQDPDALSRKLSIVDVLCQDEKGIQYIIEMQVAKFDAFAKRAQYYAAKAYTSQMNNGDEYKNLKAVIFLAITDFVMFPEKSDFKSYHVILDRETYACDLKDFSFTFLELPKFNKTIEELESLLDKWMYFFKHAPSTDPEELETLKKDAEVIGQAYQVLDQCYWTKEQLAQYEKARKDQRDAKSMLAAAEEIGVTKGKAEGKIEGKDEAKHAFIINLIKDGVGVKKIMQYTGASEEEIK